MTRIAATLRKLEQRKLAVAKAIDAEPCRDHRVYPQGWSYAMIEREAARRYQSSRDIVRKHDWTWAVDEVTVRQRMSREALRAAHVLYELQQTAVGDVDSVEAPRTGPRFYYHGTSARQVVARRATEDAKDYVRAHPEASEARMAVFDRLFDVHQPTLSELRWRARPGGERVNAKGRVIRMNQREVIDRIVWCCEALADIGAGLSEISSENVEMCA